MFLAAGLTGGSKPLFYVILQNPEKLFQKLL